MHRTHIVISFAMALAVSGAFHAHAQPAIKVDVPNLCSAVAAQTLEYEPRHDLVLYQYQQIIFDASNVNVSDTETVIAEKVRRWFDANKSVLVCNQVNFTPRNGSILKLAIARQAGPFIDDILRNWQVELNAIDAADAKTVLDYISERRTAAGPSSQFSRTLSRYYDRFRASGARHAAELKVSVR